MAAKKTSEDKEVLTPAETQEVVVERKPAPKVTVVRRDRDDRAATCDKYDSENPDWKHSWQHREVSADKLSTHSMEVVKEGGQPVRHGGDVLVRQPIELFNQRIRAEQEEANRTVRGLVKPQDLHKYMQAKRPVTPVKPE